MRYAIAIAAVVMVALAIGLWLPLCWMAWLQDERFPKRPKQR